MEIPADIRPVWLAATALSMLAMAGCRYPDMGVGNSPDMTPKQAQDDARYAYGELPVPLE